jgi:hypothetical protein
MKTIFALCGLILLVGGWFYYQSTRLPDKAGVFTGAPKATVAELTAKPKAFLKKTVTVEGVVTEQCTSMGCYFFFHEGKDILRVDLQDIAMNAPRKNGHHVLVEGQMVKYGDGFQLWASAVEFK